MPITCQFQPILMMLVSKFMVHRALSDKTFLSSVVALVAVVVVVKTQFSLGSGLMLAKCCLQMVRYARLIGNAYLFHIIIVVLMSFDC